MFCKEHFDFQALDDILCVMRLHFEEDGVSVAFFFFSFSTGQITLLGHRVLIW